MDQDRKSEWPRLSPLRTGIRCRCPRCGRGKLFDGFLTLHKRCAICNLDFSFADPADGPAFFVICFASIPPLIFGVLLQVKEDPPFWVHLLTTFPLVILLCLAPLRPLKGWLVCSQYIYRAAEGRVAED